MPTSAKNFFTREEQEDIKQAILDAELDTSGEIRVHIENKFKGDILKRAASIFQLLEMDKTDQRNGVLFYLSIQNRSFAIIGDEGINTVVPEDFWENTKQILINHFREGQFADGIIEGIHEAGKQLKKHFPYTSSDVNELSDEISFGNN
ncbi:TLP18.3, Psb32 and MOLO-1 founding protein of phosphatase [Lentimicrobium saccharophilum]|uniref:TLP18.3, Psb32 and MOLO-1 founding protein of phosphatase n=1 Tax=Lentimicrobium saccharophilum TaxID=1678841 RepID=A0A0S7C4Q4_9BACT|nr:TPM domain-containing protein [Lentimicrobium saccharophilum]GAP44836.1 TLP18.3, Psb32 and MOLO-1 founding protein of phosphatase [Lentimicrobium saccharophilum]